MQLQINKDKAIKILRDRLRELDEYNFNAKAWKDRTILDLREIFPLGSSQWLQVSQINFDTFVTSEKIKVLSEGKATSKKLLNSYIDFINEYSVAAQEKHLIKEKDFEQKYYDLLKEWNELVPGYNEILGKYDKELDKTISLLDEIEEKDKEIERMKSETIQLDNVSMIKLLKAFFNLPIWQIVTVASVVIGIFVGLFTLGKTYQENASNNLIFDTKTENKELKGELNSTKELIIKKQQEINELNDKLNEVDKK